MKHNLTLIAALVLSPAVFAADAGDPLAKVLDGKSPIITKEFIAPPAGVTVRRVLFRIRDKNETYAVIAIPNTLGKHPGILVLHGSGGNAEEEKAIAWAQRGYVAVAPDMPGDAGDRHFWPQNDTVAVFNVSLTQGQTMLRSTFLDDQEARRKT